MYRLEIHHIDVGQGDSTLILVKQNDIIIKSVLIDGGPSYAGPKVADYLVRHLQNSKLDIVVASHDHKDHTDGLKTLFIQNTCECQDACKWAPEKMWLDQQVFSELTLGQNILTSGSPSISIPPEITMCCIAGNGKYWSAKSPKGITFQPDATKDDKNRSSLAFLIRFGNFRYYTGGDLEGQAEIDIAKVLSTELLTPVHVFKVGHHGSNVSAPEKFLSKMKPKVAIISCGYDDGIHTDWQRYDHPTLGCIKRLHESEFIINGFLTSCSLTSPYISPKPKESQDQWKLRVSGYYNKNIPNVYCPGHIILSINDGDSLCDPPKFSVTYFEPDSKYYWGGPVMGIKEQRQHFPESTLHMVIHDFSNQ